MSSASISFWLAAAAMIVAALAFLLPRLLGGGRTGRGVPRDELNARVYRGELDELARERAAGTLSEAEYVRARADLERRLLEDVPPDTRAGPARRVRGTALAVAVLLPVLALGLYFAFGTPAAIEPVRPPGEAATMAEDEGFRAQLAAHLVSSPRDGRAWIALARLDMNDNRFGEAASHYAKALAVSDKIARDPGILCEYADALGMAQGGRLEGQPTALVERALALDPAHRVALEMAGSAAYERGDFRSATQHWRDLLAQLDSGTAAHVELAAAIERAERRASTTLPREPAAFPSGG